MSYKFYQFLENKEVNEKMLSILYEWMGEVCVVVHDDLRIYARGVDIAHRSILLMKTLRSNRLQICGIASMYIAHSIIKPREVNINKYLSINKNFATSNDFREMVVEIIKINGCNLMDPGVGNTEIFLNRDPILTTMLTSSRFASYCVETKLTVLDCLRNKKIDNPAERFLVSSAINFLPKNNYSGEMLFIYNDFCDMKLTKLFHTDDRTYINVDLIKLQAYKTGDFIRKLYKVRDLGRGSYGNVALMDDLSYERLFDEEVQREYLEKPCAMKTIKQEEISSGLSELICMTYCDSTLPLIDFDIHIEESDFVVNIIFPEYFSLKKVSSSKHEIIVKLLKALSDFHSCGFIHCDVKLDNALMNENGDVVLIDYGLSVKSNLYFPPNQLYSTGYQPPEHAKPRLKITQKSDVWAMGLTILSLYGIYLTSRYAKLMQQRVTGEYLKEIKNYVESLISNLPDDFSKKIVRLCLEIEDEKRGTSSEILEVALSI